MKEPCGQIVGLCEAGLSICAISQKLNIDTTTIHDTIKKYKEQKTFKTLPIPARPQKLNDQDKCQLLRVINQHPGKKLANIKEMITAEVSIGMVCKAIHELGKHSCIAVKKPYLTENHITCQF
ncbi:hypothetical protein O181_004108 [Austropuccinia psidii MF-1]|uniref:Transposase n=1 Tax=Austropuccinia psidii MF-1 TaxID=1389203 RepID=A0A9Q3GE76_9BASI|nr:hypothetical protein [Austropuccinia psidii MF-1]